MQINLLSMANVVIVHGTGGSPEGNWFPWLKSELEGYGCQVFVPRFPTPLGQSLEKWLEIFNEYERYLNKDAIIVGHSLGTAFLLSVLERIDHPVRAAYFVAGFTGLLDNPDFDVLNRTFTVKAFDWNKIKRNCMHFYVINSDNDPYVPVQKGIDLARDLNVEPAVLRNAGHINRDSGYVEFGFLAKSIREEIKN